jgi:hypothetical protein
MQIAHQFRQTGKDTSSFKVDEANLRPQLGRELPTDLGGYEVNLDSAFGKSSSQVHEHPFHATESERRDKERNATAFEPEV